MAVVKSYLAVDSGMIAMLKATDWKSLTAFFMLLPVFYYTGKVLDDGNISNQLVAVPLV